jgi:hypothetical protein
LQGPKHNSKIILVIIKNVGFVFDEKL